MVVRDVRNVGEWSGSRYHGTFLALRAPLHTLQAPRVQSGKHLQYVPSICGANWGVVFQFPVRCEKFQDGFVIQNLGTLRV